MGLLGALACASLAMGCGGSLVSPVQPASQAPPPIALCEAAAGTTLYDLGTQQGGPSSLATANGNLYFALPNANSATSTLVSLPVTGGTPTTLTTGQGSEVWVDGQALDFAGMDDKLWQVPIGGGDATLLADGQTTGPPNYYLALSQTFDGSNLYWDLRPQNGPMFWTVWQVPATGGAAQELADLPEPYGPSYVNWTMMSHSAQGVLLAYENFPQAGAFLVPPGGGTPEILPSPAPVGTDANNELLAISPTAVLWDTEGPGNLITLRLTDLSAAGGASLRTFWPDRPAGFIPSGVSSWSGGDDGSWLISGTETFADGSVHVDLWLVDAAGNGARIGCDPNTQGIGIITSALATPTAVYATVGSSNEVGTFDYRIVQLGR
jgi:hypothetical protein